MSENVPRRSQGQCASMRCSLSIDFGAYNSKVTLAWRYPDKRLPEIHRVPARRPNEPNPTHAGLYEFPALAAIEDGRLSVGESAVTKSCGIPLKTIFIYMAGIRYKGKMTRPPSYDELLDALAGGLTEESLEHALVEHFTKLRDAAAESAARAGVEITDLVLTYPNFLRDRERSKDHFYFMKYYKTFVSRIWPGIPARWDASEGQAAAIYISAEFIDPTFSASPRGLYKLFDDIPDKTQGVNLFLVDGGGSSFNFQVQNLYFRSDGRLKISQSSCGPGLLAGAKGGSHNANSAVFKQVREELAPLIRATRITPEEIASYVQKFELLKHTLDFDEYVRLGKTLTLHGPRPVTIWPGQLRGIADAAWLEGKKALACELRALSKLGKPFVVVVMGGGFGSPSLAKSTKALIEEEAAKGLHISHMFVSEHDWFSSSAVSAGAALAVMDVPSAEYVLRGSAIGIQKVIHERKKLSNGDKKGIFLFGPGCGPPKPLYTVAPESSKARTMEYTLVCDPNYRVEGEHRPPFRIGPARQVLNGPLSAYDLDWAFSSRQIAPGPNLVRIQISGAHITALADVEVDAETETGDAPTNDGMEKIPFVLSSCSVSGVDGPEMKHPEDTKWILQLETSPFTKLLEIRQLRAIQYWCGICDDELLVQVADCTTCNWTVCWQCYLQGGRDGHPADHVVDTVEIP